MKPLHTDFPVSAEPGIGIQEVLEARQFTDWFASVDRTRFMLKSIHFQSIDKFGPRIGFVKFKVDVVDTHGRFIPGIVFARGGSVAVLAILRCEGEEWVVVTVQPRLATGDFEFVEVCAGMLDGDGNFAGVAAKELKEELGLVLSADELTDLTELGGLPRGIHLSPGVLDERMKIFAFVREVTPAELDEISRRTTGNAEEGEQIKLKLVRLEHLASIDDAKTIAAYTLFNHYKHHLPGYSRVAASTSDGRPLPMPVSASPAQDVLVVTNAGWDPDDEDVLVQLRLLAEMQVLNVVGVLANVAPSVKRARLARGTLDRLGLKSVPVGIGSSCNLPEDSRLDYQFDVEYLGERKHLENGEKLLLSALRRAKPHSLVLLVLSGMTDVAQILWKHPRLFKRSVRRVVIMGGVVSDGDSPTLDNLGRLIPDLSAQNHAFDAEATMLVYSRLQNLGIPMTVVSRHAAGAAKVPRSVYEEMAATGHPVGIRLLESQREAIEGLWHRACLPAGDPRRNGLPDRCDRLWFSNNFCVGRAANLDESEPVWELVETVALNSPCALVAAIPNLREHYFASHVVEVNGVEHLVIGISPITNNVRSPRALASFLQSTLVESLALSMTD